MKIITIIWIAMCVQLSAINANAQLITLHEQNSDLTHVLLKIRTQTGYNFLFNNRVLTKAHPVTVTFERLPLPKALDVIFKEQPLTYSIMERTIVIKEAAQKVNHIDREPSIPLEKYIFIEDPTDLLAVIRGTVSDESGEVLIGVNIQVKGTNRGATTDFDGAFTIDADLQDTLVFSYVGYKRMEVRVNGQTDITVTLMEDVAELEELVVVGYGTQKKVNVIGSISTISSEDVRSAPVARVSNALAGRLSGVYIQQPSGEPGKDAASILIRGKSTLGENNPLIVVDGVPGRDLNSIDPQDIASLSVLKDASAGIYGARAANGVILITTKRGKEGAPSFKYDFYRGWSSPTTITEMVDAPTYAQMIREQETYQGIPEDKLKFSNEDIDKFKSGDYLWTHPNTDWYNTVIANSTNIQHHYFSVGGGTKNINYYGSFGNQFDDGIYKANATSYNRYNLRLNLDVQLNKYLRIGLNINGSQENTKYPTKSANSIFQNGIYRSKPTEPAVYPNGLPGPDVEYGDQPVVSTSFKTGFDDTKKIRSENILNADLKIPGVEGLSVSSYFSYDRYFNVRKLFQKPWTLYVLDEDAYLAAGNTGKEDGAEFLKPYSTGFPEPQLNDFYSDTKSQTFNLKINYDKKIGMAHNVSSFISYESLDFEANGISAFRRYFLSDQLPYLFAGGNEDQAIGSSVSIDTRMNFFGRVSYNYDEKYLAQFSYRRDGSLRFSEEEGRWGNFPSFLVGWRASKEDFWMEAFPMIDYFKLRASWGKLGNDAVDAFQYLTNYRFSTGAVLGSSRNYSSGLTQDGIPNPFITWEVANIFNVGFESMIWGEKFLLNAEYFHERRNDILIKRNASVPDFTGLELPDENFGIVDVNGIEVVLGYNTTFNDFAFSINSNFAFSKNKIVEFDEPERNVPWQRLTGYPIGTTLMYKANGIFRDEKDIASYPHVSSAVPGDIKILDYDGDGEITNDDRVLMDITSTPRINYGFDLSLSYKNWSIKTLIQGVGGVQKQVFTAVQGKGGTYYQYDAIDRWTPENTDAQKPRAFERDDPYWRSSHMSDYYYHDMSFMRLKNVRLSYNLPRKLSNIVFIKDANIYLSGQNLLLLYSGEGGNLMDPELGSISNYPIMKVLSFGVQITF